jgi:hypothetical protein
MDETAPCPVLAPFSWREGGKAQPSTPFFFVEVEPSFFHLPVIPDGSN